MYKAPGQGQTTLCGQNPDINRKALSLYPFVASLKKISLKSLKYNFSCFYTCIHGAGADNPLESEFLYKHEAFVTLVICCKFLPINDFLKVFPT